MKKLFFIIFAFIMLASCRSDSEPVVVTIGSDKVTVSEFNFYLYNTKQHFEAEGESDIWEVFFDDIPAWEKAKEVTVNSITTVKITNSKAKQFGVSLAEDEVAKSHEEANNIYDALPPEDRDAIGITLSELCRIMEEKSLYLKVYSEVTKNFALSETDFASYFSKEKNNFLTLDLECAFFNEPESAVSFLKAVNAGTDFETLAMEVSEDSNLNFFYKAGTFDEEFDRIAYSLSVSESALVDSSQGYYVIKLLNKYPDDATLRKNVENAYINENKDKIFQQEFSNWQSSVTIQKNDDVWNSIQFIE